MHLKALIETGYLFQSLLHQGISLLQVGGYVNGDFYAAFQSLLHQGISLLHDGTHPQGKGAGYVSIPSSSGHQFTDLRWCRKMGGYPKSFNPFFIRASVYCAVVMAVEARGWPRSFNPFFIRASVYCVYQTLAGVRSAAYVSIPSSSGHQFTGNCGANLCARTASSFNPFFIRASVYCWP